MIQICKLGTQKNMKFVHKNYLKSTKVLIKWFDAVNFFNLNKVLISDKNRPKRQKHLKISKYKIELNGYWRDFRMCTLIFLEHYVLLAKSNHMSQMIKCKTNFWYLKNEQYES